MRANLPTIIKASSTLLDEIERLVPDFPRKQRDYLGKSIREEALRGSLLTQYALMMKGGRQAQYLNDLSVSNDRLKILLQSAHHLQCFKSSGQYEAYAERARSVGRQCRALRNEISKQHLKGQSAGASVPPAASLDTEYPSRPMGAYA